MNTEAKLEFYTLLLDWLQSGKMNGDRCSAIFEACREGWHTPEFDPKQSAFLNQYMRDKIAQGHTFRTPIPTIPKKTLKISKKYSNF